MDAQITIKDETCVKHQSKADVLQANVSIHRIDLIVVKQEKVEDDNTTTDIDSELLGQDFTFEADQEDINTKAKPPVEEVIIKNEILDRDVPMVVAKNKVQKHTEERCPLCKHQCLKGKLQQHMRTHTGEKPFECKICKKKFAHRSNRWVHMRIHAGVKPFECETCKNNYTTKVSLRNHMRMHTGEKPFECTTCKTKFATQSNMRQHMRIHAGEKPHVCSICTKTFSKKYTLQCHMNVHSSEKAFECDICKKKFNLKRSVIHHMRRFHIEEQSDHLRKSDNKDYEMDSLIKKEIYVKLEIPIELTANSADNNLDVHPILIEIKQEAFGAKIQPEVENESTVLPIKSESCQELAFEDEPDYINIEMASSVVQEAAAVNEVLVTDKLRKGFECSVCKYRCLTKRRLQDHMRKHTGERPFECNICKKKFADKSRVQRHMRTHTGVKPFECSICKKKFVDKKSVPRHMKTHAEITR